MDESIKIDLVRELGLDKLSPAEQEKALLGIGDSVFQSVLMRVVDTLSADGRRELEVVLEDPAKQNNPDALYAFLKGKVPELDSIVAEEIAAFKKDATDTMGGIG